ncbi:dynamin family protein [Clostridium sp. HCP1S3_B4]|uniref:dynamin family protein n=1 Tax=unclassified Clostridium TaxID=2614128 RepID=UPI003F887AEB
MDKLDEYIGESGQYTPFVKNVTIHINKDELKDISLVDTPGLNDAVVSRTDKTRQFIEKCDVVFFLSRASQFLDANDMKLLSSQLPQKGVEKLILVCSRFDDGILDQLYDYDSLEETIEVTKESLRERAIDIITNECNKHKLDDSFSKEKIVSFEQCKNPIFVSSMNYNMSLKDEEYFDEQEIFIKNKLNQHGDLTKDLLHEIGNIEYVKNVFNEVVIKKDETLKTKAEQFIPNIKKQWDNLKCTLLSECKKKKDILENSDKEELEKQKKYVLSQISEICSSLENVLGELLIILENNKLDSLRKLRENSLECSKIDTHQGTETHVESYTAYDHHFLCFKWGAHREFNTYTTTYSYLAPSDALENIRTFAMDACSDIEGAFHNAIDIKQTKARLLKVVLDNFDSGDEKFDINHFRYIVESTLNKIEFPIMSLNPNVFLDKVSSQFTGEVRDSVKMNELQKLLSSTIQNLFEEVTKQFEKKIGEFKLSIENMRDNFKNILLENINNDYELLQKQFENKEKEIEQYKNIIGILSK